MEYKKIEFEIDNLLHNNGLNSYEKKLLRKTKRRLSTYNNALRDIVKTYNALDALMVATMKIMGEKENHIYELEDQLKNRKFSDNFNWFFIGFLSSVVFQLLLAEIKDAF